VMLDGVGSLCRSGICRLGHGSDARDQWYGLPGETPPDEFITEPLRSADGPGRQGRTTRHGYECHVASKERSKPTVGDVLAHACRGQRDGFAVGTLDASAQVTRLTRGRTDPVRRVRVAGGKREPIDHAMARSSSRA
jgi:hypothetical protein